MTWTPLKGPWTPPPELTGMTIPEICDELLRLREEAYVLRQWGNKDCVAMADEELERRRRERAT